MDLLPTAEDRDLLLERLSELIALRGWQPFVGSAIVLPDTKHFPDRWEPTRRGARVLSRRLLTNAGLGDLDARVTVYRSDSEILAGLGGAYHHEGAAAWFAGIQDGTCLFGVDERQLAEPDAVVGTMCHEVAHAYRQHHGIAHEPRDLEEQQTDLTTVYLGFGILTVNNTDRFRKSGYLRGTTAYTSYKHSSTGYLSPQSMSFLLAAQVVARGIDSRGRSRIAGELEPNQSACFKAACKALSKDEGALTRRLGLPARETWPRTALPELAPIEDDSPASSLVPARKRKPNEGRRVFRVEQNKALTSAFWGLVCVAAAAGVALREMEADTLTMVVLAAAAFGGVSGYAFGKTRWVRFCSDPTCEGSLEVGQETCPKCGGTVSGVIASAKERLAAEEALDPPPPSRPEAGD